MPGNFKKEDLRILKTRKAIASALITLLRHKRFSKITVYDICEEALVSRTAFYAHFKDKYDLLEQWLTELRSRFLQELHAASDSQVEETIFTIVQTQAQVIGNLVEDMDGEQHDLLIGFFAAVVIGFVSDGADETPSDNRTSLSEFLAGGMFNTTLFLLRNRRDQEKIRLSTIYLHKMIKATLQWDAALTAEAASEWGKSCDAK